MIDRYSSDTLPGCGTSDNPWRLVSAELPDTDKIVVMGTGPLKGHVKPWRDFQSSVVIEHASYYGQTTWSGMHCFWCYKPPLEVLGPHDN